MPPPGIGICDFLFGCLATIASVVIRRPATEAACCNAVRDDLGRVDNAGGDFDVGFTLGIEAIGLELIFQHLADDDRAFHARVLDDLTDRCLARSTILMPAWMSGSSFFSLSIALRARSRATPPLGTMPSSTAARVALRASSTRSLFSFTSISVAPPTRMTATLPACIPTLPDRSVLDELLRLSNTSWQRLASLRLPGVREHLFELDVARAWFLVPHNPLFDWIKKRHRYTPKWREPRMRQRADRARTH